MQMSLTPSVAIAVKSIQRGTITFNGDQGSVTATATISSVNTSKSVVFLNNNVIGSSGDGTSTSAKGLGSLWPAVQLTNATTVTGTMGVANNNYGMTFHFTVVEYY